jgi:hypothetical protein
MLILIRVLVANVMTDVGGAAASDCFSQYFQVLITCHHIDEKVRGTRGVQTKHARHRNN